MKSIDIGETVKEANVVKEFLRDIVHNHHIDFFGKPVMRMICQHQNIKKLKV